MMQHHYIGRFAPSPTGPLHFGSVIAALASYLDARANRGQWHLRIDDVDQGRARDEFADQIPRTLETLGLQWDGPIQYQQAQRERYEAVLEQLKTAGRAYPCACSRKALSKTSAPGPAGLIYPGYCRNGLPPDQPGRSWRFAVTEDAVQFDDRHAGWQSINPMEWIGDFIIKRGDGLHAYHLAMVVDDAALGITDVVRGADLLPATAPQILLQQTLGYPTPRYLHVPVAVDADGRKLSKTNHAASVDTDHPGQVITDALDFLGHPVPAVVAREPVSNLLEWAIQQWQPDRLPALPNKRV